MHEYKENIDKKALLKLYKEYLMQANQKIDDKNMYCCRHDNSGGHPNYHCNTHDNYVRVLRNNKNGIN